MKVISEFTVQASLDEAYSIVTDVKRVAPCFPGARLTEAVDDDTYKGEVAVALGPVKVNFAGKLQFLARDIRAHTAKLRARGKEKQGRGAADARINMTLESLDAATRVVLDTNLNLAGPVAQYGRGAGMIEGVAQQVLNQFADNLAKQMSGEEIGDAAKPISGVRVVGRAVVDNIRNRGSQDADS